MFILIISRGFPSSKDVMNGNFEADQARALKNVGHKVVVASIDRRLKANDRHWGINYRIEDGIEIYNLNIFPFPIKTMYKLGYAYIKLFSKFLLKLIGKKHGVPDILHAHYLFTMPIAIEAKKMWNCPCVGTEHWSYLGYNDIPPHVRYYAERVYHGLDVLVSVSSSLKKNIFRQFGVDSIIIPNMLNVSNFNIDISCSLDKNEQRFSFVSVGALVHGKCFDLLLKAFSKLSFENKHLNIVGDGPNRQDLIDLVRKLGIENSVEFSGKLSRDQLSLKLAKANVFVLPSVSETFGVVYIEAMATGLPVIATKCGGPEDFVENFNGLLIDKNDEKQLIDAMEYIYSHYHDYDSRVISEFAVNKFSSYKVVKQVECVYHNTLSKKIFSN